MEYFRKLRERNKLHSGFNGINYSWDCFSCCYPGKLNLSVVEYSVSLHIHETVFLLLSYLGVVTLIVFWLKSILKRWNTALGVNYTMPNNSVN